MKRLQLPLMKFIKDIYNFDIVNHLKDIVIPCEVEERNIIEELTPKDIIKTMNKFNVTEEQAIRAIVKTIQEIYKASYIEDYTKILQYTITEKIESDFIQLMKVLYTNKKILSDIKSVEILWNDNKLIITEQLYDMLCNCNDDEYCYYLDDIFENLDNEISMVIDNARGSKEYTLKEVEKFI